MFSHNEKVEYISGIFSRYGLNSLMCLSIYNIETDYRRFLFRVCENIFFIINFIANKIFGVKIKNITIGVFQIGLTSILKYNGYNIWQYYDYIPSITFKQAICLVKAMFFRNNVQLFCEKIKEYGICMNDDCLASKYGEFYNGNPNYILMLHREYERLKELQETI